MPQTTAGRPRDSDDGRTKQIKKEMVMKKRTQLFATLCLLIGSVVVPAYGQNAVKVRVPFNFIFGDKTYAAGEYAFSATKENVIVQNSDGTPIAMRIANHVTRHSAGKNGQVVFKCYLDQCFLFQIWTPGGDDGRQLLRSPMEFQVTAKRPGTYMALLGKSSQP
jgi:hypothetical protein